MNITIRPATVADVPELAELRHAFTFEDPAQPVELCDDFEDAFAEIVGTGITSGRWAVWVAEANGEIVSRVFVGLIDKIPRPIKQDQWLGYVTNVYTRPEHRGRGIGATLLDRVTTWAAAENVELLVVWPSDESIDFYERAGFSSGRDPLVWYRE